MERIKSEAELFSDEWIGSMVIWQENTCESHFTGSMNMKIRLDIGKDFTGKKKPE